MRRNTIFVATALLCGSMLTSSCVGSFSLFNKLAVWNKSATNSKALNEIIFILISPAYAVCSLADVLVLNSIEFWSGSNPVASNVGKTIDVKGQDGRLYAVKTLKNGYEVKSPDGAVINLVYDKKTDSWSQIQDGKTTEIFRFNTDGTIQVCLNGKRMNVTVDEYGLNQVATAAGYGLFYAAR